MIAETIELSQCSKRTVVEYLMQDKKGNPLKVALAIVGNKLYYRIGKRTKWSLLRELKNPEFSKVALTQLRECVVEHNVKDPYTLMPLFVVLSGERPITTV